MSNLLNNVINEMQSSNFEIADTIGDLSYRTEPSTLLLTEL
jgi:hypothetical protein